MNPSTLKSDAEVAALFGFGDDLASFHERRRYYGWPCTKFGRKVVAFTDDQIAQIVAMQARKTAATPVSVAGQTKASASRKRAS